MTLKAMHKKSYKQTIHHLCMYVSEVEGATSMKCVPFLKTSLPNKLRAFMTAYRVQSYELVALSENFG